MFDQCTREALVWWCVVLLAIHPWAATGAAFGCCFFLAAPMVTSGWQRMKLSLFSFGLGYAAGVFWYGKVIGEPWNEKAMLVSGGIAALCAIVFTAAGAMVESKAGLPKWVKDILGYVPFVKQRSNSDGS